MYNNDSDNASGQKSNSEQILEKLVLATLTEQRRKRRWGIFFKLIFLAIVILFIWGFFPWDSISLSHFEAHHALKKSEQAEDQIVKINLFGEIGADTDVDAYDVIDSLDEAVEDKTTKAIILDIDSPGGSPVQASYIYNEIRRLQKEHKDIPIDAVCEDTCASAAYYIASAANNIYANPTSLVGSIGVLMDEFGFVDTMKKVGVTRRLYTAGKYKGLLDPFSPISAKEVGFVQTILDSDHQIFIQDVKAGRGSRLKDNPDLFTGLIWNGVQAKQLGLIDGFGSVADIAREKYDSDNIVDYTVQQAWYEKLASKFGETFWHQFKMEMFKGQLT